VTAPRVARFRAEYGGTAGIVGVSQPTLSWTVADAVDWEQARCELQSGEEAVEIESSESHQVPWPFSPLASRERRSVRVRATSRDGRASGWSAEVTVEAGLLDPSDWTASFVGPHQDGPVDDDQPCPFLRREFAIDGAVADARLYITALGVYEPYLNGSIVGDHVLAPNWTSYNHRLRYQVFDVTDLLRPGRNTLGAILGDGWYRGRLWAARNIYGDRLALIAQLDLTFEDGSRSMVVTDSGWRTTTGPILASSLYDGERYDARRELDGWAESGYDDGAWQPVVTIDHPPETLVAPLDPPIRRIVDVAPEAVLESPSGKLIVDFGQNLVGRLRITVSGESGEHITLRHAEVLQDGELALEPLFTARAEDAYILKGGGVETWEPRFTYHGFRYVEIDGWPGEFDASSVAAVVLHSDLERTGWFTCSDESVTQLHENAVWSMRGNFLGLPTDCPQRSERLGWTGDIQLFAPAASFLYDVNGILASWLADLAADQAPGGEVPHVIPNVFPDDRPAAVEDYEWVWQLVKTPAAAWGDAAVIVPWVLHQRYGDRRLLAAQWESMRSWVEAVARLAGPERVWRTPQFGDWLDPTAPRDRPHRGQTPSAVVATAYFARSAELVSRVAEVLGRGNDAARYGALADEVRAAFQRAFCDEAGNVDVPSATAQALVLEFSLACDEAQRLRTAERLSQIVAATGHRISTGFVGTPIICDALCAGGDLDGAYRLLLQTDCPSWLYPLSMGATTIWERWDALRPDGTLPIPEMTSFNHYAFGAIVDWLHRTVAGLEPAAPGYRSIRFRPRPGGGLTSASARHLTPYGPAAISWRLVDDVMDIDVEVPPNTRAELVPPNDQPIQLGSGEHTLRVAGGS
jgi:alpha-L-rhamnosidase